MKRFDFYNDEDDFYIIAGSAKEIKPVVMSMIKASAKGKTDLRYIFCDNPKFNPDRIYGIVVDNAEMIFEVINESTLCRFLINL